MGPENKLEVKPESKPDVKPENTVESKPEVKTDLKPEVNPKSDRNPPEKINNLVPVKPSPVTPKPAVSPPPVSNQNPLERIRSRFFPPQPRAIPKADPTPNQSNAPTIGPSSPKVDNAPVGPSVGKKE
jgi:hypothetical protein